VQRRLAAAEDFTHYSEVHMPKIFHAQDTKLEKREARLPFFEWHQGPQLGDLVKSKYLQFRIRSLDPGKFSFPYHFHRACEELFVIFSGEATLRSPEGFQKVEQGDILFFEEGASGAHQLYNHSGISCVYLDIRTTFGIDVCEYPDTGKINILPFWEIFEKSSEVDYFNGEENVTKNWPENILRKNSDG
jgi:uncharacterized cupin superfamily protein